MTFMLKVRVLYHTLMHTHLSLSFQQVVAICMDIFMTDRQDGGQITSKRSRRRLCIIMPEHRRRTPSFCVSLLSSGLLFYSNDPFSTLTWSEFEWTFLYVHGEIREIHGTAGFNCQSTGVEHASVLIDAHKLIRGGYRVQIALFAIVKICIRLPDARQHRDGQRQRVLCAFEGETLIHPGLAKITIHRVGLQVKRRGHKTEEGYCQGLTCRLQGDVHFILDIFITYHIHLRNGTHATHHYVHLNGSRRTCGDENNNE